MRARLRGASFQSTAIVSLLFLLTLPAVTTRFYASDEVEFFSWLRSVAFDHDANFQNEYQRFYDTGAMRNAGFHETFLELENEAGRRQNFAPIGTAVLWAPFFAAGHVVARMTGQPADGFSQPYITAVTIGSAVYGFLSLLLTFAIVRRVVGGGLRATIAVWIGTPLVFYMYVAPGFSHACSAFAVSLFLWTWLSVRDRWTIGGALLLGLSGALMSMVREQDLFFVVGPSIDFLRWAWRRETGGAEPRAVTAAAAAGAAAFALGFLPQLAAYNALNGHPSPTDAVARKMTWTSPHALGVLASPQHGFFFWTPLALVALAGLVWLAVAGRPVASRDGRWIAIVALVMAAFQVYVSGSVESWTVAGSFGQRRFVALTPILALGLAVLDQEAAATRVQVLRWTWAIVLALGVWWNVGLMAQFGLHTMDRQRLSLADNARATFVDLPTEAPSLVWRYFADRSSLFGLPRQ